MADEKKIDLGFGLYFFCVCVESKRFIYEIENMRTYRLLYTFFSWFSFSISIKWKNKYYFILIYFSLLPLKWKKYYFIFPFLSFLTFVNYFKIGLYLSFLLYIFLSSWICFHMYIWLSTKFSLLFRNSMFLRNSSFPLKQLHN